ncbi:hypothetical protein AB0F71_21385 [Kitasatospora sp. NPDC028055]|uniref:hypothetical protein n=1 Tax=Kitasatospora sp. NPDC028055 TaxID=3155653 RepID=UPI0033FAB4ED
MPGTTDTAAPAAGVTEDPDGLVDPEFTEAAENPRFDVAMVGVADLSPLLIAGVAAVVDALLHLLRGRRNPVARAAGSRP